MKQNEKNDFLKTVNVNKIETTKCKTKRLLPLQLVTAVFLFVILMSGIILGTTYSAFKDSASSVGTIAFETAPGMEMANTRIKMLRDNNEHYQNVLMNIDDELYINGDTYYLPRLVVTTATHLKIELTFSSMSSNAISSSFNLVNATGSRQIGDITWAITTDTSNVNAFVVTYKSNIQLAKNSYIQLDKILNEIKATANITDAILEIKATACADVNFASSSVKTTKTMIASVTSGTTTNTLTLVNNSTEPTVYLIGNSLPNIVGVPTQTGYTFNGYFSEATGGTQYYNANGVITTAGSNLNISTQMTFHAHWTINTYTIAYDDNGATSGSVPSSQIKTYGTNLTLQGIGTLAKTGYTFGGWNTNASGTGTNYSSGATLSTDLSTENGATITLYAKWEEYVVPAVVISVTWSCSETSFSVSSCDSKYCSYTTTPPTITVPEGALCTMSDVYGDCIVTYKDAEIMRFEVYRPGDTGSQKWTYGDKSFHTGSFEVSSGYTVLNFYQGGPT